MTTPKLAGDLCGDHDRLSILGGTVSMNQLYIFRFYPRFHFYMKKKEMMLTS